MLEDISIFQELFFFRTINIVNNNPTTVKPIPAPTEFLRNDWLYAIAASFCAAGILAIALYLRIVPYNHPVAPIKNGIIDALIYSIINLVISLIE